MKTYQEFKEEARKQIKDYLPKEYQNAEVFLQEVTKNNDTVRTSLVVKLAEQNTVPQIYLEESYHQYCENVPMDKILQNIAYILERSTQESPSVEPAQITNYEQAKEQLVLQVINKNSNENRLKTTPFHEIENTDLVTVFRIEIPAGQGVGSILVSDKMMEQWGVDIDTIYKKALQNTQELHPFTLQSMESIMMEMLSNTDSTATPNQIPENLEGYMQYVLSNTERVNGAVSLLYPNVLEEIGNRFDSNFFLLPSSIHEIILMQDTGEMSAIELQRMVMEVNGTQVEPEEVLSNQVYSYNHKENALSMATSREETAELQRQISDSNILTSNYEDFEEMEQEH